MPQIKLTKSRVLLLALIVVIFGIPAFIYLNNRYKLVSLNLNMPLTQPKVKTIIVVPTPSPVASDLQKGPYSCPSISSFCQTAKDINQNGDYFGFGADLPENTPIFAAFDGQVNYITSTTSKEMGEEKMNIIYLDNKEKALRAVYYTKGDVSNVTSVKAKEGLGRVGKPINLYQTSFVFQLIKNYTSTPENIHLNSADFLTK